MTRILNASLKKFMGAKYERVPKTLIVWAILFIALRTAEIRIEIAPAVLWLTTLCLTVNSFVGVLLSDDIIDSLRGQLMLPESPVKFHAAFFLSIVLYALLTKAGLLLIAFAALSTVNLQAIIGFAVCFLGSGATVYPLAFRSEKKLTATRSVGDAGQRCESAFGNTVGDRDRNAVGSARNSPRSSFVVYLLRYLRNNKNYLVNTVALWAFGCIFSVFMSKIDFPNIFPLGFALMCLNTPLGILLSSDGALYRHVLFLPDQIKGVLFPYGSFVALVNTAACAVYLTAWFLVTGNIAPIMVVSAAAFSTISAALTVLIEMKYPLLNRKVENDLWHHPRKYIVPGIMVLLASLSIVLMGGF